MINYVLGAMNMAALIAGWNAVKEERHSTTSMVSLVVAAAVTVFDIVVIVMNGKF